jgi:hypothetical protein
MGAPVETTWRDNKIALTIYSRTDLRRVTILPIILPLWINEHVPINVDKQLGLFPTRQLNH